MKLIVAAIGGACLLLSACGGPAAETPAPDLPRSLYPRRSMAGASMRCATA